MLRLIAATRTRSSHCSAGRGAHYEALASVRPSLLTRSQEENMPALLDVLAVVALVSSGPARSFAPTAPSSTLPATPERAALHVYAEPSGFTLASPEIAHAAFGTGANGSSSTIVLKDA